MAAPVPAAVGAPPASLTPQQNAVVSTLWTVGSRLKDYAASILSQRKPWAEVLDRTSFAKPANFQEAASRVRKNLTYFRINYLIVLMLSVAVTFIVHPSSLFVLAFLLASWVYVFAVRQGPLVINGREISEREKLLSMAALSFVVVFFLTNVGNVVFSAIMFSGALVAAHGACRVPDDLFLDDAEANTGLLSIFTGGAQSATTVSAV